MFDEFKELLSAFNARNVKYLIVGGYAVSVHAQPRATKDIDIFIAAGPENAQAVYAALCDFGAPLESVTASDFAQKGTFFRIGRPPLAVDIMTDIPAVEFEHAWQNRVQELIDPPSSLVAFYISPDDLIASKLASGRLQDLADVEALLQLRNRRL